MEQQRQRPRYRPITATDIPDILHSDQKIYPTASPLSESSMARWYAEHPELGMIYYNDECETIGTCCVVLLKAQSWRLLTNGKLQECDLDQGHLFTFRQNQISSEEQDVEEVGIHIYHMEKNAETWPREYRMGTVIIEDIGNVISTLSRQFSRRVKVVGLSGLAVSKAGAELFSNLYNCRERDYVCCDYIFLDSQTGMLNVVPDIKTQQQLEDIMVHRPLLTFVTRVRMLTITPSDPSIVWMYLNKN